MKAGSFMAAIDNARSRFDAAREFKPVSNPPAEARVRAVIMADDQGELQVVAPEQALLDLSAVERLTGRKLRARPFQQETPTSAIPGAYGIPVILDEALTSCTKLALTTEEVSSYV
jgi:hypothetical protein